MTSSELAPNGAAYSAALLPPSESNTLQQALARILAELDKSGSAYALLHGGDGEAMDVSSDIDLAFAEPPPLVIEPILKRLSTAGELTVVQRLHYDVAHGYYYVLLISGAPTRFLHLDCLCDPLGIGRYRLSTAYLLRGMGPGRYAKSIAKDKAAMYLLVKRTVKSNVSEEQLNVLRTTLADVPDTLWPDVERRFGHQAKERIDSLLRLRDEREAARGLRTFGVRASRRLHLRHPVHSVLSLVSQLRRTWLRLLNPTGFFVVIVGPDGSGKSTVARAMLQQLERAFRKTWLFHWRPGLLPKLSRSQAQSGATNAVHAPPEESKYRGVVSLARFLYYWADFVLGYWVLVYPRKTRTTLIIAERYFPDVVVHPARYGFSVPGWLLRLAAATVPSPDLLVILKGDPNIIFARKGELSPARIARQIRLYEEEGAYWPRTEIVDTEGGAAAVTGRLTDLVLDECASRLAGRLERHKPKLQWRAFPSARRVKIWLSTDETLRCSLQLYHPYSLCGGAAKWIVQKLPTWFLGMLFRRRAAGTVAAKLRILTTLIRKQLGDHTLTVSFATGTPGPHRKLTAQAARNGTVLSYVKIAQDPGIGWLLEHEAEMLRWLQRNPETSAYVPEGVSLVRNGAFTMLFVSAPSSAGRRRPQRPDAKDMRFLSALAGLGVDRMPVAELWAQTGAQSYVEQGLAPDRKGASVLCRAMSAIQYRFGERGVSARPCHGDYGPWNTLEVSDGNLFVIDWEYGEQRAPALTDLFHRFMMPARYVLGYSAKRLIDELLKFADEPACRPVISRSGATADEVPAYVLIYLIGQLAQGRQGRHEDGMLLEMIDHTLQALDAAAHRRRVLVLAYACQPNRGSEPGVGWRMVEAISREHDAWVVTRRNNRADIEAALVAAPNPHLHFVYVDLPAWARFWKRHGRGIRIYYYMWQFAALGAMTTLARKVRFDIAHHITFVNDYLFTALALQRIPYVWGPVGSPGKWPRSLREDPGKFIVQRAEYCFKTFLRTVDPLVWLSAWRAKLIIGVNDDVGRRFPLSILARNKYITHTAIGVEKGLLADSPVVGQLPAVFQIISMGRLIRLKGFDLAVRAFARLAQRVPFARLKIVGDGPLKGFLQRLANELGVVDQIDFVPHLPRPAAMALMQQAQAFLFPSCEAEGMVVLEALAAGVPVVCLAYGGPGNMATPDCGFAVKVGPSAVEELALALEALALQPALQQKMSEAARQHIRAKYLWEGRHEAIREWYAAAGVRPAQVEEAKSVTSDGARGSQPEA